MGYDSIHLAIFHFVPYGCLCHKPQNPPEGRAVLSSMLRMLRWSGFSTDWVVWCASVPDFLVGGIPPLIFQGRQTGSVFNQPFNRFIGWVFLMVPESVKPKVGEGLVVILVCLRENGVFVHRVWDLLSVVHQHANQSTRVFATDHASRRLTSSSLGPLVFVGAVYPKTFR